MLVTAAVFNHCYNSQLVCLQEEIKKVIEQQKEEQLLM